MAACFNSGYTSPALMHDTRANSVFRARNKITEKVQHSGRPPQKRPESADSLEGETNILIAQVSACAKLLP